MTAPQSPDERNAAVAGRKGFETAIEVPAEDLPEELRILLVPRGIPDSDALRIPGRSMGLFPAISFFSMPAGAAFLAGCIRQWIVERGWRGSVGNRRALAVFTAASAAAVLVPAWIAWRRSRKTVYALRLYGFGFFRHPSGLLIRARKETASFIPSGSLLGVRLEKGRWWSGSGASGGWEIDAVVSYRTAGGDAAELRVDGIFRAGSSAIYRDSREKAGCRAFFGPLLSENEISGPIPR